ncbi:MAG: SET domain-containing protein-lysine N-methyltransferase [Chitinophagaceae bacterium]|nr:SET domain-containing protein-lysine N-methyltransferase [Chitinophagaceae bacterium]
MQNIISLNQSKVIVSKHVVANVYQDIDNKQFALHAAIAFNKGDVIADFSAATTQSYASYLTVQVDTDKHITLKPAFLQYINHSCEPTVFFDTALMQLTALTDIKPGQEFTFFYPSTEWDMAQPFVCNCGSKNCLQLINGAKHLDKKTLQKYQLTQFINQQLQLKKQEA